jgi:hypothetical protein
MLIEQVYPGWDDHAAHFDWLLKAFTDKRYLSVDGKPIFIIYRPDDIPNVAQVAEFWRERALHAGLPGIYLIGVSHRDERWDPRPRGLDASTMQALPQRDGRIPRRYALTKLKLWLTRSNHELTIWDYEAFLPMLLRRKRVEWHDYPLVLPNWDNTPRTGMRGVVLVNSSPELFRRHLHEAVSRVQDQPEHRRLVFLKAWNEWAEGNHVEPDLRYGRGYLEAIRDEVFT